MSHSVVLVLVDPVEGSPTTPNLDMLPGMLATFDEGLAVPTYDAECWCVGSEAASAAHKATVESHGEFDLVRKAFWSTRVDLPETATEAEREAFAESEEARWQKLSDPWSAAKNAALDAHPLKDKPKADCEDCGGKGTRPTTYNPNSKWDWYVVGGRWTAMLVESEYDPTKDPRNMETCFICNGSGMRNDNLGKDARRADPNYTCNGCGGSGKHLKHPPQWVDVGGNHAATKRVAERIRAGEKGLTPFAILTPDLQWIEKGKMGWWGAVSNEKRPDEWSEAVLATLDRFPDKIAVVVDVHI